MGLSSAARNRASTESDLSASIVVCAGKTNFPSLADIFTGFGMIGGNSANGNCKRGNYCHFEQ